MPTRWATSKKREDVCHISRAQTEFPSSTHAPRTTTRAAAVESKRCRHRTPVDDRKRRICPWCAVRIICPLCVRALAERKLNDGVVSEERSESHQMVVRADASGPPAASRGPVWAAPGSLQGVRNVGGRRHGPQGRKWVEWPSGSQGLGHATSTEKSERRTCVMFELELNPWAVSKPDQCVDVDAVVPFVFFLLWSPSIDIDMNIAHHPYRSSAPTFASRFSNPDITLYHTTSTFAPRPHPHPLPPETVVVDFQSKSTRRTCTHE